MEFIGPFLFGLSSGVFASLAAHTWYLRNQAREQYNIYKMRQTEIALSGGLTGRSDAGLPDWMKHVGQHVANIPFIGGGSISGHTTYPSHPGATYPGGYGSSNIGIAPGMPQDATVTHVGI